MARFATIALVVLACIAILAGNNSVVAAEEDDALTMEERMARLEAHMFEQKDVERLRHFFMNWMYKVDDVANNAVPQEDIQTMIDDNFAEDVVMDLEQFGRYEGKESLKDWVTWLGGIPWHRHHVNHLTVDLLDDERTKALIRCTSMRHANFLQSGGGPDIMPFWHSKIIKWDLEKVDGDWKVKYVYQHSDFVTSFDGPGWFEYAYPPGLEPFEENKEGEEGAGSGTGDDEAPKDL